MSKSPPHPLTDLPEWTAYQRERYKESPLSRSGKDIDLTAGGPQREPFQPAINLLHLNCRENPSVLNQYNSTIGTFKDSYYIPYLNELGIRPSKPLSKKNILPGNGTTQLYAAATQTLLTEKDVLLVPVPSYGYFLNPKYLGKTQVRPLLLRAEDGYKLDPEYLDREMTRINRELAQETPPKRITAFLHINPHNPTGTVATREDVQKLSAVLMKQRIGLVIDDMVYAGLEYGHYHADCKAKAENEEARNLKPHHAKRMQKHAAYAGRIAAPIASVKGMFDRTITLLGLSKTYSMPGVRAGLAVGPEHLLEKLRDYVGLDQEFTSNLSQLCLAGTYQQDHKKQRDAYLSDQAREFCRKQYLVRALVSGWDKDTQACAFFDHNPEELVQAAYRKEGLAFTNDKLALGAAAAEKNCAEQQRKLREDLQRLQKERAPAEAIMERQQEYTAWRLWFDEEVEQHRKDLAEAYRKRDELDTMAKSGIKGVQPVGAVEAGFFQLLDVTAYKGKYYGRKLIADDTDFVHALKEETGVCLLPGRAMGDFGDRLLVRMSLSPDSEMLVAGIKGIGEFIGKLRDRPYDVSKGITR
jgi:aspartate/methionine/tyrosine aminotransferase